MTAPQNPRRAPARRTLVKGAAWSVPLVAATQAARAASCSPANCPVVVEPLPGSACKHQGRNCNPYVQAYRFTFCFTNTSTFPITVSLPLFRLDDGRQAAPSPSSVQVPATTQDYCIKVYLDDQGNSSNGEGCLDYSYVNPNDGLIVTGSACTGANNLPPCPDCP